MIFEATAFQETCFQRYDIYFLPLLGWGKCQDKHSWCEATAFIFDPVSFLGGLFLLQCYVITHMYQTLLIVMIVMAVEAHLTVLSSFRSGSSAVVLCSVEIS